MARRHGGRIIDTVRWAGFQATFGAFGAGTSAVNLLGAGSFKETVMRTRGQLLCYVDGAVGTSILAQIGVGFVVVPEGTASTVLWSPITDTNAPWYYYSVFHIGYEEAVADVVHHPVASGYRETIDSKAMRKGPPDTELQMVVENVTIAGAVSVNLSVTGRHLLGS